MDITRLRLEAKAGDGRALVQVREFGFRARAEGFTVTYEGGCVELTGAPGLGDEAGQSQRVCQGDGPDDVARKFGVPFFGLGLGGASFPDLDLRQPELGFVAVERDGKWYVSPTRTVLDNVVGMLRVLDRPALDAMRQAFESFTGQASAEGFVEEESGSGQSVVPAPEQPPAVDVYREPPTIGTGEAPSTSVAVQGPPPGY
jgi:hypothetical protein